jgi:hypothetical protein
MLLPVLLLVQLLAVVQCLVLVLCLLLFLLLLLVPCRRIDTAHGGDVNSVTKLLYSEKMLWCVNWNRNGFFF